MPLENQPPTTDMQAAVALLIVFLVAVVAALIVTVLSVSAGARVIALASVSPLVVLTVVFIFFCRRGRAWSFAGGAVLGAVGVGLRVVVSTQPKLEVGGGLPVGITVVYIVLGALVALVNFEAYLDLKKSASPKTTQS
jgi:hypothetical protein